MTGYGRARRQSPRLAATVELRSVNGRHLQTRVRVPQEHLRLELPVETAVRQVIARGSVDVFVRVDLAAGQRRPVIDRRAVAVYRRALQDLGDGASGAELLRLPGVVTLTDPELPERAAERTVLGALKDALADLERSRAAEGRRLASVLRRELGALRKQVAAARALVPAIQARSRESLQRRVAELLGGQALPPTDPSLLRELALLADRGDVSEELDRLVSHLVALEALCASSEPAGRPLDFLLQEVGREVNTLASKLPDARLTALTVAMKTCVERLREQAANIE